MSLLALPLETARMVFTSVQEVLQYSQVSHEHYAYLNQAALWYLFAEEIGIHHCELTDSGTVLLQDAVVCIVGSKSL